MQASANTANDLDQWRTLADFPTTYPNFHRSQLEWMYRNRSRNGMASAFRRIGKRRYVHAGRFAELLLEGKG